MNHTNSKPKYPSNGWFPLFLKTFATLRLENLLNIESLLFRIARSQLRWFGHVSRITQKQLPKQTVHAEVIAKRQVGRPQTRWLDYIEELG